MPMQINGTTISWYVVIFILGFICDAAVKWYVVGTNKETVMNHEQRIVQLEQYQAILKDREKIK